MDSISRLNSGMTMLPEKTAVHSGSGEKVTVFNTEDGFKGSVEEKPREMNMSNLAELKKSWSSGETEEKYSVKSKIVDGLIVAGLVGAAAVGFAVAPFLTLGIAAVGTVAVMGLAGNV